MNKEVYTIVPQDSIEDEANSDRKPSICARILYFRGYLFAISAAIFFPMTNLFVKKAYFLNGFEHLVIFFNNKLILLLILNLIKRNNPFGSTGSRKFLFLRGIVGLLGYIFLYIGLIIVPLSDSSAISHSSIIITAILSRIFLKEKLGLQHILALILTISGVLLISKPSFLFQTCKSTAISTNVSTLLNITNKTSVIIQQHSESNFIFLMGITFVIVSAIFFGSLNVIVKQLCNFKVKWYVITIYDSYTGLPVTILTSYLVYKYNLLGSRDFTSLKLEFIIKQIVYSSVSSICCIIGQISVNLALKYEDPTKVSIIKASDVVVAFFLQTIVLRIKLDVLSLFGSLSILLGVFIVFTFKLVEKQLNKSDESETCDQNNDGKNSKKSNLASKFVTFKF